MSNKYIYDITSPLEELFQFPTGTGLYVIKHFNGIAEIALES